MKVLAAGTAMVDVLAVGLDRIATPSGVVYTEHPIETRIGGHPVDVAIDLVKLGESPDEVGVVAAIGTGLRGEFVMDVLQSHRIPLFGQLIRDVDTGCNVVLKVHNEDRRLHVHPGANWQLDPDHVIAAMKATEPEVFCVRPGYCGIDMALDRVINRNTESMILLDLMEPHPSRPDGFLRAVLPRVDILHGNATELCLHAGVRTLRDAVAYFRSHGVRVIFATNGEADVLMVSDRYQIRQPTLPVDAIDTTGCGDAFCAGVVRYLTRQGETRAAFDSILTSPGEAAEALLFGQAAGAAAATLPGCVEGVSAELVDALIYDHGARVRDLTTGFRY